MDARRMRGLVQAELRARGLADGGKKAQLHGRLVAFLRKRQ
jgi:hypothetical protein